MLRCIMSCPAVLCCPDTFMDYEGVSCTELCLVLVMLCPAVLCPVMLYHAVLCRVKGSQCDILGPCRRRSAEGKVVFCGDSLHMALCLQHTCIHTVHNAVADCRARVDMRTLRQCLSAGCLALPCAPKCGARHTTRRFHSCIDRLTAGRRQLHGTDRIGAAHHAHPGGSHARTISALTPYPIVYTVRRSGTISWRSLRQCPAPCAPCSGQSRPPSATSA